jgi:hypothetical protein
MAAEGLAPKFLSGLLTLIEGRSPPFYAPTVILGIVIVVARFFMGFSFCFGAGALGN